MEELHHRIKTMSKDEYDGYLKRIRDFLESDAAKKFTYEQLAEDFYQAVIP